MIAPVSPPRAVTAKRPRKTDPAALPIQQLLAWYRRHRRTLPFRPTAKQPPNAYHVLVSEAMAQQTQIATVVPYFERFVAAFPTVAALADADEQEVLNLWQGLGYYRRARHLHAAAQRIVESFGGGVPDTVDDLLSLPGVGRYTAGAVASVAYDRPAPIVDGNVARVYARYFAIRDAVDRPETLKELWRRAQELVEASGSPRDYNQAVMELGALICGPKSPTCLACPLREGCRALAEGRTDELPVKTPKKKPVAVTHTVLAVERGNKFLFEKRPPEGLWSNMWQLPTLEDAGAEAATAHMKMRFGFVVGKPKPVAEFKHQTTHRTIRFEVFRCAVKSGRLRAGSGVWRKIEDLDDLPLAKPQLIAVRELS